jgi:glucosamine-6-phosphate deaminase
MHREEGLDFSRVTTFNLDEYSGLGADHPCSFHTFMHRHLFDHINIDASRIHIPDGLAADPVSHAQGYEHSIRSAGGIDLQILGIGHNGHIAFNEPGSAADSRTRLVHLTHDTIEKNSRFFDSIDDVPRTALTMGIGTILDAKRILLLAMGPGKAEAVCRAIQGERSVNNPASLLQTHHDVTYILDQSAAALLD